MPTWLEYMKSIPLPDRLNKLKKDRREYVITFATLRGSDGNPKFRWVNDNVRRKCFEKKLCGICGEPLDPIMVNIIDAAFLKEKDIVCQEAFMHEDCARYAAQVCPYLALGTYKPSGKEEPPPGYSKQEWDRPPVPRPSEMILYYTDGYKGPFESDNGVVAIGNSPARESEVVPCITGKFSPTTQTTDANAASKPAEPAEESHS